MTPYSLDAIDRQLIVATQTGLPLTPTPYATVAAQVGISEAEALQRLQALQQHGVIRRIGVVPNHYKLGYRFNGMSVWDVDDAQIDVFGRQVGDLPFVSHCYRRPRHLPDWPYNLFAMVHGKTREEAEQQVAAIRTLLGDACRGSDVLFSQRILKKTGLRLQL